MDISDGKQQPKLEDVRVLCGQWAVILAFVACCSALLQQMMSGIASQLGAAIIVQGLGFIVAVLAFAAVAIQSLLHKPIRAGILLPMAACMMAVAAFVWSVSSYREVFWSSW